MMSVRVGLDHVADYVPLVSTVNNLVDLFQKYVYLPRLSDNEIQSNHYYAHLKDKSLLRMVILCLPIFVNNLIILVIDVVTLLNKWERDGALKTAGGDRVNPNEPNLKVELRAFSHDKEIVLAAVRQDPENFQYAVEALRDDREVVRAALTEQKALNLADVLPHIGPNLKKDVHFMISILPYFEAKRVGKYCEALLRDPAFSQKLDELTQAQHAEERASALAKAKNGVRITEFLQYRGDKEFALVALRHHSDDLVVFQDFLNDPDVIEVAIKAAPTPEEARRVMGMWGWQFKDNPDFMKRIERFLLDEITDREQAYQAICHNEIQIFQNISSELRGEESFMFMALLQNMNAFPYVSDELKNNKAFVIKVLGFCRFPSFIIPHIPEALMNDPEFIESAKKASPAVARSLEPAPGR